MASLGRGDALVTNADATVRHIWKALITGTPTWVTDDAVTWGADGVGVVTEYDIAAKEVSFYRTSGALPVVGDTIVGPSDSGVLSSFSAYSPPDFISLFAPYATKLKLFSLRGGGQIYNVSETIASDSFELTSPYAEDTDAGPYGVAVDFTATWALALVQAGDANAAAYISRAFAEIERRGVWNGALLRLNDDNDPSGNVALTAGPATTITFGHADEDTTSFFQSGGFEIPAGVTRARFGLSVKLDTEVEVELKIEVSGGAAGSGYFKNTTSGGQLWTPAIQVSEGETVTATIDVDGATNLLADDATWFAIDVREL